MKNHWKWILLFAAALVSILLLAQPWKWVVASADEQDVIELTVEKVWDDNEGSSRPDSIEMEIFQNSGFYDAITLTKEDGWVKTIMVPRTDENGNEYDYEVEETVPDGYESTVRKTVVRDGQTDPEGPENPPAPASYTVTWYDEEIGRASCRERV